MQQKQKQILKVCCNELWIKTSKQKVSHSWLPGLSSHWKSMLKKWEKKTERIIGDYRHNNNFIDELLLIWLVLSDETAIKNPNKMIKNSELPKFDPANISFLDMYVIFAIQILRWRQIKVLIVSHFHLKTTRMRWFFLGFSAGFRRNHYWSSSEISQV